MKLRLAMLLLALAAGGALAQPAAPAPYADRAEVRVFIRTMVDRHGFVEAELMTLFSRLSRVEPILQAIATPAEVLKWPDYRALLINQRRIDGGVAFWKLHQRTLVRAERAYGVPPEVIVAIIGVETSYGRNPGKWRVVEALATLAFDYPPRAGFFRSELENYLLLVRDADVDVFSMRGSYAGAIGIPQFMPSSLRRYAVDFDKDGRIDLNKNYVDAIGSVGSFLKQHGWRAGQPVQRKAGSEAPEAADGERVIDLGSEKRVGLANFQAIMRYNRSPLYAAAVADLAEAIVSQKSSPKGAAQSGGK